MICTQVNVESAHGFTHCKKSTNVEGEVNGLMTYDRKVIKLDENRIREINQQIVNSLEK